MSETPPDEGSLSPDDLRRLGLAGHGELPGLPRWLEGLPTFFRALRPGWRGLLFTVLLCTGLDWLGFQLFWALHPIPQMVGVEITVPSFGEFVVEALEFRLDRPLGYLGSAPGYQWRFGFGALAPLLAIGVAVALLRSARGSVRRVWIGAAVAAAGGAGIVWSMFGPSSAWDWDTWLSLLFPNVIILLAGGAAAIWLVFRATRLADREVPFTKCAPALVVAALVGLNLEVLIAAPIASLESLCSGDRSFGLADARLRDLFESIWPIAETTTAALGALLLLVPALIVTRGLGFRAALRFLGRLAGRHLPVLAVAYIGLAIVALLPIGESLRWALLATGVVTHVPSVFPGSLLFALCVGLQHGIFLYATALAATALADSFPRS